jgi:cobalt/nickel transport system permease protein
MHIPDGFISPGLSAGLVGASAAILGYSISRLRSAFTAKVPVRAMSTGICTVTSGARRVLTSSGEKAIYKMGMVAALVFAAQMFNFPIDSGTSGHLIGGVLAAVLLGPFAGAVVISVVLAVQMLFFADGGVLALGANIINMAFAGTILAYCIYDKLKRFIPEWSAIMAASWFSVMLAAFFCAVQIGLSGTIALGAVMPAMLRVHAVIGVAEALITIAFVRIFRSFVRMEEQEG